MDQSPFRYSDRGFHRPVRSNLRRRRSALAVLSVTLVVLLKWTGGGAVASTGGEPGGDDPRARFDPAISGADDLRDDAGADVPTKRGPKLPSLERVAVAYTGRRAVLAEMPSFESRFAGRVAALTGRDEFVFFTINPDLQEFVSTVVRKARAPHVAAIVMDPRSGRVLAASGKSPTIPSILRHSGFPAASIFKVVTAAAAIERRSVDPGSVIRFRGGNYTLTRGNYRPDPRSDRRQMTIGEAMGRSCNPVFGRIALGLLDPGTLRSYATSFGFDTDLGCDVTVAPSTAVIPDDDFEFSRTGAGFGSVTLTPIHAVTMMSGLVRGGVLPVPTFVDKVIAPTGVVVYKSESKAGRRIVSARTASSLLEMMRYTTTMGTSRKEFMHRNKPVFPDLDIAAKTGTLSGNNPKGLNNWFIAAAPMERAKVALAVIVVNPQDGSAKASHIGRLIFTKIFGSA